MSENNFEGILSSIMSDPELISKISQIAKSTPGSDMSQILPEIMSLISNRGKNEKNDVIYQENENDNSKSADSRPTINEVSANNENGKASEDLSDLFSKIIDTSSNKSDNSNQNTGIGALGDSTANMIFGISRSISKNEPLLCALKPYLSKERQEIIDSIVRLSKIANLMKLAR